MERSVFLLATDRWKVFFEKVVEHTGASLKLFLERLERHHQLLGPLQHIPFFMWELLTWMPLFLGFAQILLCQDLLPGSLMHIPVGMTDSAYVETLENYLLVIWLDEMYWYEV